ncbi:MAG: ribosome silencing factor [Kiritimatiellaeota bacterium]|nr:ribosome silencing factor [Kiritimatiellota bacterium]
MNTTDSLALAKLARQALLEKKAVDPMVLDVRKLSSVTDFYLIATGNSAPHLKAIAEELNQQLRTSDVARRRQTGEANSGWVVVDCGVVVVHLFLPHTREYYALEELWNDAPRVE